MDIRADTTPPQTLDRRLLKNAPRRALSILLEQAEELQAVSPNISLCKIFNHIASCYIQLAEWDEAKRFIAKGLEQSRKTGDRIAEIDTTVLVATVKYQANDFPNALIDLQHALAQCRLHQYAQGESAALQGIARVFRLLGDFPAALQAHQESLKIREQCGDDYEIADSLMAIGLVHQSLGNQSEAIISFTRGLSVFEKLDDRIGRAMALGNLGASYEGLQQYPQALSNFEKALPIFEAAGDTKQTATTLCNIGLIHSATGGKTLALQYIHHSLTLRRRIENRFGMLMSILALHECHKENGTQHGAEALSELLEALSIAESIQAKKQIFRIHLALSESYEGLGDAARAFRHYKQYDAIKSEVFSDESDKTLKNLQVRFDVEQTKKQAELERIKNTELAEALADAERQRTIAQEASRIKSEVLNAVAHDLQTPMSSVVNFAWLLKQASSFSEKEIEMLSRIETVSQTMLQKTVDLLTAAQREKI